MSGGIKYRLTSKERALFADQLGVLEALRARLRPSGVEARIFDAELQVHAEEGPEGPRFTVEYPFDNDVLPNNGRIYVKDVFQLNSEAGTILSFERSLKQDVQNDKRIAFWVDLARKDHPASRALGRDEHLQRFLKDLDRIPKPATSAPPMQSFLSEVLSRLHRPFPADNEALVRKNLDVFRNVIDSANDFGIRMKFGDTQSGLNLRRKGDILVLTVQIVFDNDPKPGIEAERNGRMYLIDTYEIDPKTWRIQSTQREITPSEVRTGNFERAFEQIKDLPPPDPNMPELQTLVHGWLQGLGQGSPPQDTSVTTSQILIKAPKDTAGKHLFALYQFTERDIDSSNQFVKMLSGLPNDGTAHPFPLVPEADREAIHDSLGQMLANDGSAAKSIDAWLEKKDLEEETRTLLTGMKHYAIGELQAANDSLFALSRESLFARIMVKAVAARAAQGTRAQAVEILKLAVAERIENTHAENQAWGKVALRGFSSGENPDQRRVGIQSFFKKLEERLAQTSLPLVEALSTTVTQGLYEKDVKTMLLEDPLFAQLADILGDSDPNSRDEALINLARTRLLGTEKLPATAKKIAELCNPELRGTKDLLAWFSGKANFGQKIEVLLPAFAEEVLAPKTLVSMMAAGSLAQLGKAAFLGRVGYQTKRLRWAAEAFSVAVEAPAFVLSDKILTSTFQNPDHQWDHVSRDVLGAFVAFGTLRAGSIGSRRLLKTIGESKGLETWAAGRSSFPAASRWSEATAKLATAEGRYSLIQRPLGKVATPVLNYLGKTGISRTWVPGALRLLSTHGLNLGALTVANSLSRFLKLRPATSQGWTSDMVDDFLMYGHFVIAGHLAQRLGRSSLESRLALIEQIPVKDSKAPRGAETKIADAAVESPTPNSERPSSIGKESAPKVDLPPEVKAFGRNLSRWIREVGLPGASQHGRNLIEFLRSLRWENGRPVVKRDSRPSQRITVPSLNVPFANSVEVPPMETPLLLSGATEITPASTPPISDSAAKADPIPKAPENSGKKFPPAVLRPSPERVNFRPVSTPNTPKGKGGKIHLNVEVLGREEELAFQASGETVTNFEAILGREEIQNPAQAAGIDFGFASIETGIALKHAMIKAKIQWQLKSVPDDIQDGSFTEGTKTAATPKEWKFFLEDLNSPTGTFINGKRIKSPTRLEDGDKIRLGDNSGELVLRLDPAVPDVFLMRPEIPLGDAKQSWTLGREHAGEKQADIRFPLSDRDLSREHARFERDAEGRYFLQDLSRQGTRVDQRRVHGTQLLKDGDTIQLSNGTELTFELPPGVEQPPLGEGHAAPKHPRNALPPPEQSEVHPTYRGFTTEELDAYFLRVAADPKLPPNHFRAGDLRLPDGRSILLSSMNSGWSVGVETPPTNRTQALQFSAPESVAKNPAQIYLDGEGRFVLQGLKEGHEISVQSRKEKYFPDTGAPKDPAGPIHRLEGWTLLEGGERIFLGQDFWFDFWPGNPASPHEKAEPTGGNVTVQAFNPVANVVESHTPTPVKTLLFRDGEMQLRLDKPIAIRSTPDVAEPQIRDEATQEHLEILVPESLAKIHETRIFNQAGQWKIRSEGGAGESVLVNGMRLPSKIALDLRPDTVLQIGTVKIKIGRP